MIPVKYPGPNRLQKPDRVSASVLDSFPCLYKSLTDFAPIGKPHKNPMKIQYAPDFEHRNTFCNSGASKSSIQLLSPDCTKKVHTNRYGNRLGIMRVAHKDIPKKQLFATLGEKRSMILNKSRITTEKKYEDNSNYDTIRGWKMIY